MSNNYSLEQFNMDMEQLGGMIENFYTTKGGGKKRRSHKGGEEKQNNVKMNNNKKSNNKMNNKMNNNKKPNKKSNKKGNSDGTRHYKVLSVNGRPYPFYRRYKGAEPKDAAKKAGKFICKKLNMSNKNCKLKFQLKETTRGSDKRVYGPYVGNYEKLSKPRTLKFPGKKQFTVTHKFMVKLDKK